MSTCPRCGKKFSWWQRVVGDYKEHVRLCVAPVKHDKNYMSMNCRGCPADCFRDADYSEQQSLGRNG